MPQAFNSQTYRRFWTAYSISLTGTWVRITAMGYLVYDLTDDEFRLGLVSFAQAAPVLVVSPFAGILLDRLNRRHILLTTQSILLVLMALLTLAIASGHISFGMLMLVSVILGTVAGFDWPARTAIIPSLVPREDVSSAIALNAVAFNSARILGPMFAGWLIGLLGITFCFGFTFATLAPFVIVIATLRINTDPVANPGGRSSGYADMVDGFRYIRNHETIRGLLSVDLVPLTLGWSYFTMAPALARDVLGLGSQGLGLLITANGIGALIGTLIVASTSGRGHRGRLIIIGVTVFGVLLIGYGLSTNYWLTGLLILGLGLSANFYAIINDTLLQLTVDDAYRGRVTSVYSMLYGLTPIGSLFAGILSRSVGLQAALAINGAIILGYILFIWLKTPVQRLE